MAENESLDLSSPDARRWKRVVQALRAGRSSEEIAQRVETALYRGLRAACKQMGKFGVSLKDFIAAVSWPGELDRLVKKVRGHEYARLFQQTVIATPGVSTNHIPRAYVEVILERVRDQLSQFVVPSDGCPSYPDSLSRLSDLGRYVDPIADRLAERIVQNPSRIPRKPPRPRPDPEAAMAGRLAESLLEMRPR